MADTILPTQEIFSEPSNGYNSSPNPYHRHNPIEWNDTTHSNSNGNDDVTGLPEGSFGVLNTGSDGWSDNLIASSKSQQDFNNFSSLPAEQSLSQTNSVQDNQPTDALSATLLILSKLAPPPPSTGANSSGNSTNDIIYGIEVGIYNIFLGAVINNLFGGQNNQ